MSDFRIDQITNQAGTAGPQIAGITTFSSSSGLLIPSGPTEYRGGRGRGLFGGGNTPTIVNTIDYITISTLSNSYDFGDLNTAASEIGTFASSTHGFFAGGLTPSVLSSISRVTISSTGNAFAFGELDSTRWGGGGLSNSTRGIYGKGRNPAASLADTYSVQYLNMASGGKTSYFGDLLNNIITPGVCASPVRGLFAGGGTPNINNIEYITITSLGNGTDFGDLAIGGNRRRLMGLSNSTRGIFTGGYLGSPFGNTNVIEYATLSSLGDTTDFGDLTKAVYSAASCASSTRGIISGGYDSGAAARTNTIQYITISSTGNSQNFGELSSSVNLALSGLSDAHGGLGD